MRISRHRRDRAMDFHAVRRISHAASVILLLLLLGPGCRPSGQDYTPIPPDVLLNRVETSLSRLHDLKGNARVAATFYDRRGQVDTRIQFRRPGLLKIFIHGGFMQVLGVLRIEDEAVQFYLPQDNVVFEGTMADRDVVVPGMEVPLNEIWTAAVGLVDMTGVREGVIAGYRRENDRYALAVQDSVTGAMRTLWIDAGRAVITREEDRRGDGTTIVRVFETFRKHKGVWMPGRIRIANEQTEETVEVTYHTQAVNTGLTEADLALRLPESVRRLPLDQAYLYQE